MSDPSPVEPFYRLRGLAVLLGSLLVVGALAAIVVPLARAGVETWFTIPGWVDAVCAAAAGMGVPLLFLDAMARRRGSLTAAGRALAAADWSTVRYQMEDWTPRAGAEKNPFSSPNCCCLCGGEPEASAPWLAAASWHEPGRRVQLQARFPICGSCRRAVMTGHPGPRSLGVFWIVSGLGLLVWHGTLGGRALSNAACTLVWLVSIAGFILLPVMVMGWVWREWARKPCRITSTTIHVLHRPFARALVDLNPGWSLVDPGRNGESG